ncbi:MAG: hypothetical protein ABIG39_02075, partial [Candidatus Micrarchaeota archaeon]
QPELQIEQKEIPKQKAEPEPKVQLEPKPESKEIQKPAIGPEPKQQLNGSAVDVGVKKIRSRLSVLEKIAETKKRIDTVEIKKPTTISDELDSEKLDELAKRWKERNREKKTNEDPISKLRKYRKKKESGDA